MGLGKIILNQPKSSAHSNLGLIDYLDAIDLNKAVKITKDKLAGTSGLSDVSQMKSHNGIFVEEASIKNIDDRVRHHMIGLINESAKDPYIRELTSRILRGVPARDDQGEAKAIFDYIQKQIRFTSDPALVEAFSDAQTTDRNKAGDCDDMSIMGAALLKNVGFENIRIKVISAEGDDFDHVYLMVGIPKAGTAKQWLSFDPSLPHGMGYEYPNPKFFKEYDV